MIYNFVFEGHRKRRALFSTQGVRSAPGLLTCGSGLFLELLPYRHPSVLT